MLFFVLTILLLNGIAKSLEKALDGVQYISSVKTNSDEQDEEKTPSIDPTSMVFEQKNRVM